MPERYYSQPPKKHRLPFYFLLMLLIIVAAVKAADVHLPEIQLLYNQAVSVSDHTDNTVTAGSTQHPSESGEVSALESSLRYSSLSPAQKKVYLAMRDAVAKHREFVGLEQMMLKQEDFHEVWNAILYTDPYLLATGAIDSVIRTTNGQNLVISITFQYYMDAKTMQEQYQTTQELVKKVVSSTDGMNDLDKSRYFHDYLVLHASYSTDPNAPAVHNAYSCLSGGYCVCEGYTKAYKLLCDEASIPCDLVLGGIENTTDHVWNLNRLNGVWSHVDVTFDDPTGMPDDYISYSYFNLSTAEITKTHMIDQTENFPIP